MRPTFALLFCVVLFSLGYCSDYQLKNVEKDIGKLLKMISDAKRDAVSDEEESGEIDLEDPANSKCIEIVFEATGGDTQLAEDKISNCMTECLLAIKDNGYFNTTLFHDQECLPNNRTTRGNILKQVLQMKGRKKGNWYEENKSKIWEGVHHAATILIAIFSFFG